MLPIGTCQHKVEPNHEGMSYEPEDRDPCPQVGRAARVRRRVSACAQCVSAAQQQAAQRECAVQCRMVLIKCDRQSEACSMAQ